MSPAIPKSLESAIEALRALPGVGPRTAERYAYYLFKSDRVKTDQLTKALADLHRNISYCPITFALVEAEQKVSPLYSDPRRDKQLVAVVADAFDIVAIEKTGHYHGTYHVLGGLISPIEGITPEQLHLNELKQRLIKDRVKELILATNASVEGESTALLITQEVSRPGLKITRLARGLPVGVDLEYADQITLSRAFEGRQKI